MAKKRAPSVPSTPDESDPSLETLEETLERLRKIARATPASPEELQATADAFNELPAPIQQVVLASDGLQEADIASFLRMRVRDVRKFLGAGMKAILEAQRRAAAPKTGVVIKLRKDQ